MFFVDKYYPKNIDESFFHKNLLKRLKFMASDESIPHMIFHGISGSGKKTIINLFLKMIYGDDVEYTLLANHSKKGCLIPSQKSVNFFLLIKNDNWQQEKTEFISRLREVKDILLVFEVETNLIKQVDRFIFNDKKN